MRDLVIFLIKLFIYVLISVTIWLIVKIPYYIPIFFLMFLVALLLAHLVGDKEIEILVILSSVFVAGSIILLHNYQPYYNILFDKALVLVEMVFMVGVFVFLQKKAWELEVYSTSFREKIEKIEEDISRINDTIKDLQVKIYNINEVKNNFKAIQEVITTLSSVSSISSVKNYVVNLAHKIVPDSYVELFLNENEVPEDSLELYITQNISDKKRFFYIENFDEILRQQKLKIDIIYTKFTKIKCVLGYPINIYCGDSENVGYLIFISPKTISEENVRMLSIFSSYVGISISNIKLIEYTRNLSITDTLTGLYVHKYFKEILEEEINRARFYLRTFSVAMFDIDNFKQINDTYGHNIGDKVLVKFAEILRKRLREVDKIFRYGGDEFAVIFPDTNITNASKICEELRNIVLNETIVFPTSSVSSNSLVSRVKFTISGGVMEYSKGYSMEVFLDFVDKLLYKSKASGKNQISYD